MSIKEFVIAELSGWKKREIIGLVVVFSIIIINASIVKDNIVAVISAFCGILYSTIAGKGKISCYLFGLTGTGCYSWLAFSNGLWGNLLLYMCYYLPMQIMGVFSWRKHLNEKKEIEKRSLSAKSRFIHFFIAVIVSVVAINLLKYTNGSHPICDGITTVFSVLGMYFTVRRCIEQWFVWMLVNGLSSVMWLNIVLHGAKTYATFIMWVVYFILSIYFYFSWKKEIGLRK